MCVESGNKHGKHRLKQIYGGGGRFGPKINNCTRETLEIARRSGDTYKPMDVCVWVYGAFLLINLLTTIESISLALNEKYHWNDSNWTQGLSNSINNNSNRIDPNHKKCKACKENLMKFLFSGSAKLLVCVTQQYKICIAFILIKNMWHSSSIFIDWIWIQQNGFLFVAFESTFRNRINKTFDEILAKICWKLEALKILIFVVVPSIEFSLFWSRVHMDQSTCTIKMKNVCIFYKKNRQRNSLWCVKFAVLQLCTTKTVNPIHWEKSIRFGTKNTSCATAITKAVIETDICMAYEMWYHTHILEIYWQQLQIYV